MPDEPAPPPPPPPPPASRGALGWIVGAAVLLGVLLWRVLRGGAC